MYCLVPQSVKENNSLGNWVHNVRQRFKNGKLSDEQVAMLNEIGFVWEAQIPKADIWAARYDNLVALRSRRNVGIA